MGFFWDIIDFFTNTESIGFPLLIGIGMGVIVYLMNKGTRDWHHSEQQGKKVRDRTQDPNLPVKPF